MGPMKGDGFIKHQRSTSKFSKWSEICERKALKLVRQTCFVEIIAGNNSNHLLKNQKNLHKFQFSLWRTHWRSYSKHELHNSIILQEWDRMFWISTLEQVQAPIFCMRVESSMAQLKHFFPKIVRFMRWNILRWEALCFWIMKFLSMEWSMFWFLKGHITEVRYVIIFGVEAT